METGHGELRRGHSVETGRRGCDADNFRGDESPQLRRGRSAEDERHRYHLREKNFESNDFEPSKADVEDLSIDDFNAKYENTEAYTIGDIEDIIADL